MKTEKLLADTSIEHDWREHVDGKWIDLFLAKNMQVV